MEKIINIRLEDIRKKVATISPVQLAYFTEATVRAFEISGHTSPIYLSIEGDFENVFEISWDTTVPEKGWKEIRDIVENAAIGIAFITIFELTDYEVIEQSVIGTGFDYWLGHKTTSPNFDTNNFMNARLEISGILKGNRTLINKRIREKLVQVGVSDYLRLPAVIIVTEFGTPICKIIEK